MVEWAWGFYRAVVLQNAYASSDALDAVEQNLTDLIDPTSATAATAQATANDALNLATAQKLRLDAQDAGSVTISETNSSATVTFTDNQADTSFFVVASADTYTGTPPAEAYLVKKIDSKATTGFTLVIGNAPGTGNSVTFNWCLMR
ncbi:MAG: hypothetical protein EG825_00450 [Rhodocyclaceae bacterium]|nr:hypothetical protein [Rhodocyclaceae bacterium]